MPVGLVWHHDVVAGERAWWRGASPSVEPRGRVSSESLITGRVVRIDGVTTTLVDPLQHLYFFSAQVSGVEIWLTGVQLTVEWSEFDGCHFRQRRRPVLNSGGVAAQGCFGNSPAVYRSCIFEGVRFKTLGGFTTGRATFEGCTFLNCRWEGHFAYETQLIGCRFLGRMDGCVWGGESHATADEPARRNLITGNDFSRAGLTDNVGWRAAFPLSSQVWPTGYIPVADR